MKSKTRFKLGTQEIRKSISVLSVLFVLSTFSARSQTTVVYYSSNFFGGVNNTPFTLSLASGNVVYGGTFLPTAVVTCQPTNGGWTNTLLPLTYNLTFPGVDKVFRAVIPSTTNVVNLLDAVNAGAAMDDPFPAFASGTNLSLTTNYVAGFPFVTINLSTNLSAPGNFTVSGNLFVDTSLDIANGLIVGGSSSLDGGLITTDGAGNITGTSFHGPVVGNVAGNVTGNVTGNTSGTASTITGSLTNNSQVPFYNDAWTNGFKPVQPFTVDNQMPIPLALYDTYYDYTPLFSAGSYTTGGPTGANFTNVVNKMIANNFIAAGWDGFIVDLGWESPNVGTRNTNSALAPNAANWPQGMTSPISWAHSQGIPKVWLYTFYGNTPAGGGAGAGALMGSPPGCIVQDSLTMDSWGADGCNYDVPLGGTYDQGEVAMHGYYNEVGTAAQIISGMHNNFGTYPIKRWPFRIQNGDTSQWSQPTFPWVYSQGSIIFDAIDAFGAGNYPMDTDIGNWLATLTNNAAGLLRPGHIMNIQDIGIIQDTNSVVNQMTMCAIIPAQMCLVSINNSALYPFLTNAEVITAYKDAAWKSGSVVSNVASAGPIIVRPLGSNGNVYAVAFINTNTVSSEAFGIPPALFGLNSSTLGYDVRDPWNKTTTFGATGNWGATVATNSVRLFFITNTTSVNYLSASNVSTGTFVSTGTNNGAVILGNAGANAEFSGHGASFIVNGTDTIFNDSIGNGQLLIFDYQNANRTFGIGAQSGQYPGLVATSGRYLKWYMSTGSDLSSAIPNSQTWTEVGGAFDNNKYGYDVFGRKLVSNTTTPTAAQVGSGGCILWCSNGVLYATCSANGSTALTTLIANHP